MFYDCTEIFGDIIAIYPIPVGQLTFDVPYQFRSSTINSSQIHYKSGNSTVNLSLGYLQKLRGFIVSSAIPSDAPANIINIEEKPTVKASDKSSALGYYYDVKVTAKSHDEISSIQDYIYYIRDSASSFDVFLVDIDGNVFLMRGQEPSASITCDMALPRDSNHDLTVEVVCPNGIQSVSISAAATSKVEETKTDKEGDGDSTTPSE